jgi:Terminase large subunit, T4likevirus-type, N-terminal
MVAGERAPFWRREDPVLDADGLVTRGGMWRHQREWWDLPNFIRGLVTGYGGGKTMSLAKRMISLALHNAPVPVVTVSPTYPMARTTIVQSIAELLAGRATGSGWIWDDEGPRFDPHRELRWHLYQSQPYRFTIDYLGRSATILCMSGEHPDRLKGSNIAAAGIDEPFMQDKAVFEQIVARVRHPAARRREINITGTPEGVVGWGYDLFEGELRQKHDVGLVQCSSRENRALPDGYVERMDSSFDDTARAAYVEGKFVNMSSGCVYHAFDGTVNLSEDEPPPRAEWGCGMDFNVSPMAFCVFWRSGDRMHFVDEFELPNSSTEDACQRLREEYPQVDTIYPDASGKARSTKSPRGKSDFDYIRDAGYEILAERANPTHRDRFNSANAALRHRRVTISPNCPKLRRYLMAYSHEEMHREEQKAMSHLLDAWSYPIHFLMPATKASIVTSTNY